ncbi:hypothetical protein [Microbulbifer sp. Q7]|uniref:hypothetical protein n=1 Tax=Microbulbifer sp. Q7 TaxID=1785091 RepID=UPI000833393C|nr:hypothetical protein [Microbulbifer sp. Q7]
MSDKSKFLLSAFISYGVLIFIALPINLFLQGSTFHEVIVFLSITVLFSLPVAFGLVTIGYSVFYRIKIMISSSHYLAVFCGAAGVAVVLSGLANIVGFLVVGGINNELKTLFLYPTLAVSALATVVYLGLEKWS